MSGSTGSTRLSPARRWLAAGRSRLTGQRLNRAVLAVAVVLAVTAVSFGSGYRSSRAALGDGGAYVQKGPRVVHVNADNRDVDAVSAKRLATGKQTLEVVQVGPGSVFVVNNDTGVVTELPTETLQPQPVDRRPTSRGKLAVVTGGGATYLVDAERGTVDQLEKGGGRRTPVPVPAKVVQAVVDSQGTAWGYAPDSGELIAMTGGTVRSRQRVAGAGEQATLTLVADSPVLYRPESGRAGRYDAEGPRRLLDLDARYGVVAAPGAATVLAVVVPSTGELVVTSIDGGEVRRLALPERAGHRFGPPVLHRQRLYLPDYTGRHVLVIELTGLRIESTTPVPGKSDTFQVTARDERVWVNDPHDTGVVVSFDADGRQTEIDVPEEGADRPRPTPTRTPTTSPDEKAGPVPPKPTRRPNPPRQRPAPKLVTVPDLTGADQRTVCDRLEPQLRCVRVAEPDGAGETDKVLRTDPPAGSQVNERTPVTVFYRGPASVPALVGMPADQACRALVAARLTCREQVGGLAPDGTKVRAVTQQNPAAGSRADTGSPVTIVYPTEIAVPNLAGQPYDVSCPTGLTCVPRDLGPGAPAYVVVAQNPAPGSGLPAGGTVTLDHRSHPGVPNVVGMDPGQACATLRASQLDCGPNDSAATRDVNRVLGQDPAPGTRVPAGTRITYTYESTGPVPLHRFKAPSPRRANYLSPGGGGPAGWSPQSTIGQVYPPGQAGAVPGLSLVYRSRCDSGCGEVGGYYYSANPSVQVNWVMEGEAFACFQEAVPGTVELHALFHPGDAVWVWAEPGSGEHNTFLGRGFQDRFRVCNVWPRP